VVLWNIVLHARRQEHWLRSVSDSKFGGHTLCDAIESHKVQWWCKFLSGYSVVVRSCESCNRLLCRFFIITPGPAVGPRIWSAGISIKFASTRTGSPPSPRPPRSGPCS
jgi:hypothetical protein